MKATKPISSMALARRVAELKDGIGELIRALQTADPDGILAASKKVQDLSVALGNFSIPQLTPVEEEQVEINWLQTETGKVREQLAQAALFIQAAGRLNEALLGVLLIHPDGQGTYNAAGLLKTLGQRGTLARV